MKKTILLSLIFITCCLTMKSQDIMQNTISETKEAIAEINTDIDKALILRGVDHVAKLWRKCDGSDMDFKHYCLANLIKTSKEKEIIFLKISKYFESLFGYYNCITIDLNFNIHVSNGELHKIDEMFSAYAPDAHLKDDLYSNKTAFYIALNYPYFSNEEKLVLGRTWSRLEWAYSRLGDVFDARVPAEFNIKIIEALSKAELYISDYNIYAGSLVDDKGKSLFPSDKVLLSHWNIRDEIKANYSNKLDGIEKQRLLYKVMNRIVDQSIPLEAINSNKYTWNPYSNTLLENNKKINFNEEKNRRYSFILDYYKIFAEIDKYYGNTAIDRNFLGSLQISEKEVEAMFDEYLSSKEVGMVAKLIEKRLGRSLEPFDIWYDGFKARSVLDETMLDNKTKSKYKSAKDFENDIPNILKSLNFSEQKAKEISASITVDAARGSGHALQAQMKKDKARLRTRIPEEGMIYKGYNIAIHELGHNVEQTISLMDMDHYFLRGIPNIGFTEALAFVFQYRDLDILGIKDLPTDLKNLTTLNIFWETFEIMGVSLVEMKVWNWIYKTKNFTNDELCQATNRIAKEVWNKYYAPVFKTKDQNILSIYSHNVNSPLYLSNYAIGKIILYNLEEHFKGKDLATEVCRIYKLGNISPERWMLEGTGKNLSVKPILEATSKSVEIINK